METDFDIKTSKFLEAINKYAEEQRTKLSQEANKLREAEKIRVEDEILKDAYALIKKEMADMNIKISSDRSKKINSSRKRLFERREEITVKVFSTVKERLKEFTEKKEYLEYLKKSANKFSNKIKSTDVVIYMRSCDKNFEDEVKNAYGKDCRIRFDDEICLGGMKAYSYKLGLIIDDTFDRKLLEEYKWFIDNSGLSVS